MHLKTFITVIIINISIGLFPYYSFVYDVPLGIFLSYTLFIVFGMSSILLLVTVIFGDDEQLKREIIEEVKPTNKQEIVQNVYLGLILVLMGYIVLDYTPYAIISYTLIMSTYIYLQWKSWDDL